MCIQLVIVELLYKEANASMHLGAFTLHCQMLILHIMDLTNNFVDSCQIDGQLRSQLDDAIASECPFCGDLMIREISLPFILAEEDQHVASWEIKPNVGPQRSVSLPV